MHTTTIAAQHPPLIPILTQAQAAQALRLVCLTAQFSRSTICHSDGMTVVSGIRYVMPRTRPRGEQSLQPHYVRRWRKDSYISLPAAYIIRYE